MSVYGWQEEENGKAMLLFIEELNKQVSSLPAWGSLAVGIGKNVGGYIRPKCTELQIPVDEAIIYFHVTMRK